MARSLRHLLFQASFLLYDTEQTSRLLDYNMYALQVLYYTFYNLHSELPVLHSNLTI